ncbi:D-amino acid dehydrogenase [Nitratireductor aquimarinus]|uniref:D-amino acid dehydrogenase n=1 Tax=Nitratireductor TaxID=245876 RepID=UPI0019D3660C|nr:MULTISPECIES: D-amino acid dehydrogenase [Nitratireductor]MBN7776782.1 D-amino acid dehydrogenase [Nitratireductor pacificus]MBN7780116.1 D-amino acid dehydrogenase [Nitratireductor pacificus]MBN7788923.1 D-amino acid dehydrogenase [Nitratireductor aquimarinus]MBY6098991.1 D-amino acid dehydrogenase [Nitratireductor aquimarinus]MCA1259349.1 D-amino acid dehydrogenase [Nitratireductor aquimarinus]
MRVVVLGAGVVGVTSAYYLAQQGHDVTVIDRQEGPALETSFANAGEISPGYSSPWAGPGMPFKAIKWLMMKNGPLAIRPRLDPVMWSWLFKMLLNCTSARYALNKSRMVPIAEYSRDCLRALRAETGITYDERSQGLLQLFRKQEQLDGIGSDIEILKQFGVPFEVLDRNGCAAAEPALGAVKEKYVGGLRLPGDETGDCQVFTTRLSELAASSVDFRYGVSIKNLVRDGARVTGVETDQGRFEADAVLVCLGSYSPALLRPLGLHIPVYPVKGYSLTARITNEAGAPVSTVMDETYKIAITRLGDRIRVGGTAEISGFDLSVPESRRRPLEFSAGDLFGNGANFSDATFWSGLRPMTPDSPPIIGATRLDGLYLNTGHGTLGWTMSCGSGRVIADIISGHKPEIDTNGLGIERYGQ